VAEERSFDCPSAQPHSPGARVIGIVSRAGGEATVSYLEEGVAFDDAIIAELGDVQPTRVLRFAGTCAAGGCAQFRDGGCRIGRDVVAGLAPRGRLPRCIIRGSCRWFAENGRDACMRCAQVATTVDEADATLKAIADEARAA
jgi:hypothetical protein